jgi:pyrimidine deaminase RibD-like protein
MIEIDLEMMEKAVALADQCEPQNPERTPRLGVVIQVGGQVIGAAHRGTGAPDDDDHAELMALQKVKNSGLLKGATVYSTLEPCTPHVRSQGANSCSERLKRAGVKKVFVGILDPNQGVCGKGVLALQDAGIEVELFPPNLVHRIRHQNDAFIVAQQDLGITIIDPKPGAILKTYDTGGRHTVKCKCRNIPEKDSVYAFTNIRNQWWPQEQPLRQIEDTDEWAVEVRFGSVAPHSIHIVKVNEIGADFIAYFRKILALNHKRLIDLQAMNLPEADVNRLWGGHPGIVLSRLPKGFDSQAIVTVEIANKP